MFTLIKLLFKTALVFVMMCVLLGLAAFALGAILALVN